MLTAGPLRGLGGVLVVLVLLVTATACSDESPPSFDEVIQGDVPAGEAATIEGRVAEVLSETALLLEGDGAGELLVVDAPAAGNAVVEEGQAVVVAGVVRPFTDEALRGLGVDPSAVAAYDGARFVEADTVRDDYDATEDPTPGFTSGG